MVVTDVVARSGIVQRLLQPEQPGRVRRSVSVVATVGALAAPLWSPYAATGLTLAVLGLLAIAVRAAAHQIVSRDVTVARLLSERRLQAFEVEAERARLSAEIVQTASYDRMTRLLNRAAFTERVGLSLTGASREDGKAVPVSILVVDIARFASVNEVLGADAADQLLVQVGERLTGILRPGDVVARIDGDVFAALLETVPPESVGEVARRLLAELRPAYVVDGRPQALTFACGLATAMPGEGIDAKEIIRRADVAMQNAKTKRHAVVAFEPRLEEETRERQQFNDDLRRAQAAGELHLAYQPLVDTRTGEVSAVEALMRWRHRSRGDISPAEFIPVAEASGQIVDMGLWALTEACRQQREWHLQQGADVVVAVNFSARQLAEPDVVERVREIVLREAADPRRIKLEITESLLVDDMKMAIDVLTRLRTLGLRLSIDDFGTGYSSLSRLGELPIDEIKIDRHFVEGIGERGTRETILTAAIAMGHGLGLTVVAEGVETREQLDYLRAHSCDYTQGFLLSRPVPPGAAGELLGTPLITAADLPVQRTAPSEEETASGLIVPSVLPSMEPRAVRRLFAR